MGRYDPNFLSMLIDRAEAGDVEAQYQLGLFYASSEQDRQNLINAHKWFNLAAVAGDIRARAERQDMAELMSAAEIAEAQKLARAWKLDRAA